MNSVLEKTAIGVFKDKEMTEPISETDTVGYGMFEGTLKLLVKIVIETNELWVPSGMISSVTHNLNMASAAA